MGKSTRLHQVPPASVAPSPTPSPPSPAPAAAQSPLPNDMPLPNPASGVSPIRLRYMSSGEFHFSCGGRLIVFSHYNRNFPHLRNLASLQTVFAPPQFSRHHRPLLPPSPFPWCAPTLPGFASGTDRHSYSASLKSKGEDFLICSR